MAGASTGLSDNFESSADNPAGAALTLDGSGIQINQNTIYDAQIQHEADPLTARSYGVIFNEYPWGFSEGEWRIYSEGEKNLPTVEVSETRFQISRLFLASKKLSLGLGVIIGQGREKIAGFSQADRDLGAAFGAQYLLDGRLVLGVSYTTPMDFTFPAMDTRMTEVPDFFQAIHVPYRLGVGAGWIPNRFLRLGISFHGIGPSRDAALVGNESLLVGTHFTVQPRTGLVYRFAEFKNFEGSVAGGTYYEMSRLQGASDRVHLTLGIEAKPWIFSMGAAIDHASRYKNAIVTVGVDVIQLLRRLDLIHRSYQSPRAGWFPDAFTSQDEGLDRALVKNYQDHKDPGLIDNVRDFPGKLQKRIEDAPSDFKGLFK